MASNSTASAPLSLTRSLSLHKPFFSCNSSFSLRHLNPAGRASFPFYLRRTLKAQSQNPLLAPKIRCIRRIKTRATPITKDLWENLILNSETPVLVEFYASWCGPCRMVHRIIDQIAAEYAGRLKCFVLDTDTGMQIAEDYEITAVPVVLLFKNGQKCETVIGTMPKEFYVAAIERVLKSYS